MAELDSVSAHEPHVYLDAKTVSARHLQRTRFRVWQPYREVCLKRIGKRVVLNPQRGDGRRNVD